MRIESILGKRAVRALGIAESFVLTFSKSVFCGVVYRSDNIVDGVVVDYATVGGDDATETVCRIVKSLSRGDIHVLLLDGCIVSWYNIIDIQEVYERCGIPIIALAFEEITGDVEKAIRKIFPESVAAQKIEKFRKLPDPIPVYLPSGVVFARVAGIQESPKLIRTILKRFLVEGKRPEPIRIAKFIANAVLKLLLRNTKQPQ